jgi:phosphate transport system protein
MDHHYTFHHELTNLNKKLLKMSAMVEERVRQAAQAIASHDGDLVQKIIRSDYEVDDLEIEIEEDCLKILALHQPVAKDLRFLITVIKINSEMEQIADIAVSIAKRVQNISKFKHVGAVPYNFSEMSEKAVLMLKKSIDALVAGDVTKARSLFLDDDEVDILKERCYTDINRYFHHYRHRPFDPFRGPAFFQGGPLSEFLFGLKWSPQMAIRADQVGSSGAFGAVPVFAGTLLIAGIAMLVAIPHRPAFGHLSLRIRQQGVPGTWSNRCWRSWPGSPPWSTAFSPP